MKINIYVYTETSSQLIYWIAMEYLSLEILASQLNYLKKRCWIHLLVHLCIWALKFNKKVIIQTNATFGQLEYCFMNAYMVKVINFIINSPLVSWNIHQTSEINLWVTSRVSNLTISKWCQQIIYKELFRNQWKRQNRLDRYLQSKHISIKSV